jgi:nucleotide-binding universal stress UspA family protein
MNTRLSERPSRPQKSDAAPIVVGVDASGRSASAVVWAADEAEHTGRALRLVSASTDHGEAAADEPDLARLGRRLALGDLECRVEAGAAPDVLVSAASDAHLLVVGRRGLGTAHRLVVGSTSMTVAGRSPVPVVVVPEQWMQPTMASSPVVVGVDASDLTDRRAGDPADDDVLEFAFSRAADLRVPLIAVSAWTVPALYSWSPADVTACPDRYQQQLDLRLAPWCQRFPSVEVVARSVAGSAADAILDAAKVAQLAVIGRHADSRSHASRLGSTARHVLRHAQRPVVVLPGSAAVVDRSDLGGVWAPMY